MEESKNIRKRICDSGFCRKTFGFRIFFKIENGDGRRATAAVTLFLSVLFNFLIFWAVSHINFPAVMLWAVSYRLVVIPVCTRCTRGGS